MISAFDPIVADGDAKPAIRPGTVIVAYDGARARVLGAARPAPQQPPTATTAAPRESVFNAENRVVATLTPFMRKAAEVGAGAARAGGQQVASAFRQSSLGTRLLGGGERYFLVDVGRKAAELTWEVDSASPGISFRVTLSFEARVEDAAAVVRNGIRDIVGYHAASLIRAVRDIAAAIPAWEMDKVRDRLRGALAHGMTDGIVSVSSISCRVVSDEKALDLMRRSSEADLHIQAIGAETRVGRARRDGVLDTLRSPREVLAAWIATKDETYRAVYLDMVADAARTRDEQIKMLTFAMEKGIIEAHEIQVRYPQLAEQVIASLANRIGKPDAASPGGGASS
ncbi:hypothetical protein [Methylobacterium sp. SyP6R]|uniref:hypothetical protein n=1 Tax=Methylobacterium sp. SyP6R TaxID=2718876 RepID=UPI001F38F522|nr:hypothetical protein [Methylobacterium sp. SyP6R]MCF4127617.1 hypothetical protein [Methylobacterium sp. SyP6R]